MKEDFDNIPELPAVFGPARQVAYIVRDIDQAIGEWQAQGVGPFLVARNQAPMNDADYRGRKAEKTRVNIAFAYIGDMQLELIELIGDTPSMYKEALDRNITGVHHYAVCVENFVEAYRYAMAQGFDSVVDTGVDGLVRMSYVENADTGLILEVIEWNPLTKPYFTEIEKRIAAIGHPRAVEEFQLSDLTPKGALPWQLAKFMVKKLFGRVEVTRKRTEEPAREAA